MSGREKQKLPYRVLKKACSLFAGATGFSYAEMSGFFCYELGRHPEEVKIPESSNRSEAFANWLSLFPVGKQKALILRLCKDDLPMYHGQPDSEACQRLSKDVIGFAVDDAVSATVSQVNSEAISEYWEKALDRRLVDPEGAITAARTLIETVCKHILDESGEEYDFKEDLPKLYSRTSKKLNLAPSQHTEDLFRRILGGCHSVIEGLGAIRNQIGDAHGKGKVRMKPAPRHAELAVNLAGAMATFLLATWELRKSKPH